MKQHVKPLMLASAFFGLFGVFMGGHLAGAGSYALSAIHAHMLVVGWLSLFSWGVYYQLFTVKGWLGTAHTWTAIIGTIGLVFGMWLNNSIGSVVTLIVFIAGGMILMASYALFLIIVLKQK
ncbi:hypothetical protein [Geomicrobium sp. JCM 19039]|uniref:hypothetical protein n=1 Tax=Geomicrobium sp. JCM 19039 TaxID=1460636 RepID=UPI00045F3A47|nr:hypothetical protein [Geomicrobium sp. JCM 19039]GAK12132.1 hypothetical protein JCM19039_1872 [Geomicrobium sp. JCM 19039]